MKVRSKLVVAFFIMTILPVAFIIVAISLILSERLDSVTEYYGSASKYYSEYDLIFNPMRFFCNVAVGDYDFLKTVSEEKPDLLMDREYLQERNKELLTHKTFLVILRDGDYLFIGDEKAFGEVLDFPVAYEFNDNNDQMAYIDPEKNVVIKEGTFYYSDGVLGQFGLVSDFSMLHNTWIKALKHISISFCIVMAVTGLLLLLWLHYSIVLPLRVLRAAALQIGEGDFEKPIQAISSDEIGQLCQILEDLRIHLLQLTREHMASEEDAKQFVSNMSHDLRTPVTAIKGYAEGILDGVADTPDKREKYLRIICNKTMEISHLVDEMSIFSKITRSIFAYNFTSVNLADYFNDYAKELALNLDAESVTLDYKNFTDFSTRVIVDVEQIKRVLHNITENAIKYMDKPERRMRLYIKDYRPDILQPVYRRLSDDGYYLGTGNEEGEFVMVQIMDNGPGISEKDLPHLFERSFRTDFSRNSKINGSGLGLAIVERIIKEHDGKVWAESNEGEGSCFCFTLKKDMS